MDKGRFEELDGDFATAMANLPAALAAEGFGIVSQIDLQATFAAKLGVEHPPYRIFGACNPTLAHAAVRADPRVGVLLPCNVVLFERGDGRVVVGAIDPMQTLGDGAAPEFAALARTVGEKLDRVIDAMVRGAAAPA